MNQYCPSCLRSSPHNTCSVCSGIGSVMQPQAYGRLAHRQERSRSPIHRRSESLQQPPPIDMSSLSDSDCEIVEEITALSSRVGRAPTRSLHVRARPMGGRGTTRVESRPHNSRDEPQPSTSRAVSPSSTLGDNPRTSRVESQPHTLCDIQPHMRENISSPMIQIYDIDSSSLDTEAADVSPPPRSPSPAANIPLPPPLPPAVPIITGIVNNFRGAHIRYSFSIPEPGIGHPAIYLSTYRAFFIRHVQSVLDRDDHIFPLSFRVFPEASIGMIQMNVDGNPPARDDFHIVLNNCLVTRDLISDCVDEWIAEFNRAMERRVGEGPGSGLRIEALTRFCITYMTVRNPIRLGTYVPYPDKVRGKQLIFNPRGDDNACVLRCLAAYKFLKLTGDPHNLYRSSKSVQWCLKFAQCPVSAYPLSFENIGKLEVLNKVSIYIYVLEQEKGKHYISLARKGSRDYLNDTVTLLMLKNQHLVLIKDFNQYVLNIRSHQELIPENTVFCRSCLINLPPDQLEVHEQTCQVSQTLTFSPSGEKIKFKHFGHAYGPSHLAIYDFECLLDPSNPQGMIEARHNAVAYSYAIIDRNQEVVEKCTYLGPNPVPHFIDKITTSWNRIHDAQGYHPIQMTPDQWRAYDRQLVCELCRKVFTFPRDKHRHHDHQVELANYRAAYCRRCNMQCVDSRKRLTAFSHNAAYDLAIILNELPHMPDRKVDIMSKDGFKFMRVDIDNLRFMDSLALLNGSLESLALQHIESGKPTRFTSIMLDDVPRAAHDLLLSGKQHFCYEYVTSADILKEPQLPSRDKFFNKLRNAPLSEENYAKALEIYRLGNCQNLGDYLAMYLKVDVGLLCDVFMLWRETLSDIYQLDVCHYVSLSSFAWDAFLLKSQVELDVISDPKIYDLLRRNLRGGFTSATQQITTVKNKYTNQDEGDNSKYLLYLDFNSLYATCMTELLPHGEIRQLTPAEQAAFLEPGLETHACDGAKGYWILCDTKHVSPEVARITDDLPLTLSHADIDISQLSGYSKNILNAENRKLPKNNRKLIASHLPQKDYLISLDFLQLLLKLGLEISCVHAVFEFGQSLYLKGFIDTNIRERINTTCPIRSKAFKLVNNAIYGKSLTNVEKYGDKHYLVEMREKFLSQARNPYFKRCTVLGQDRVICTVKKPSLQISTPTYIGFHILQTAKRILYDFWYNTVKCHYGNKAKLVYTDTDSYIIELTCRDAFIELSQSPLKEHMDFSNFPPDHFLYSNARKGELKLLKSEVGSKIINELIALKPKLYSLSIQGQDQICRCKGIPFHHQSRLTHEAFQAVIETNTSESFECYSLRNNQGKMCTCKTNKRGLSAFDDKRYVVSSNQSYAFGHPDIPLVVEEEALVRRPAAAAPCPDLPAPRPNPAMRLWARREEMADRYFT